jgi:hypothetical protein
VLVRAIPTYYYIPNDMRPTRVSLASTSGAITSLYMLAWWTSPRSAGGWLVKGTT